MIYVRCSRLFYQGGFVFERSRGCRREGDDVRGSGQLMELHLTSAQCPESSYRCRTLSVCLCVMELISSAMTAPVRLAPDTPHPTLSTTHPFPFHGRTQTHMHNQTHHCTHTLSSSLIRNGGQWCPVQEAVYIQSGPPCPPFSNCPSKWFTWVTVLIEALLFDKSLPNDFLSILLS